MKVKVLFKTKRLDENREIKLKYKDGSKNKQKKKFEIQVFIKTGEYLRG